MTTATKTKHITKDEERELIRAYQQEGSVDALEALLLAHNPYVKRLASTSFKQFNEVVEYEDLVQQARMGIIKAAKQFDLNKTITDENSPNYGSTLRFLTYAHQWMIAQMQDAWHQAHPVHIPAHTLRAIHFKSNKPETVKGEERKKMAKLAMRSTSYDAIVDAAQDGENHNVHFAGLQSNGYGIKIQDPTFEDGVKNIFSPSVTQAINKLTDTEWKIYKMKMGLEHGCKYPFDYIAESLNITEKNVIKLFKRAKKILEATLNPGKIKGLKNIA